jgi:hypothetical protein
VVSVEAAWKLIDGDTGRTLNQVYIANESASPSGVAVPLVPGAGRLLPVFVLRENNRLEPMLTLIDGAMSKPIGGRTGGVGTIVNPDGLILTNRRIAAAWTTDYEWPAEDRAGVVAVLDPELKIAKTAVISRRQFPRWAPKDAAVILRDSPAGKTAMKNSIVRVDGRNDTLEVRFAASGLRAAASIAKVSERVDMATIRIAPAQALKSTSLRRDSDLKPGDSVLLWKTAGQAPMSSGTVRRVGDEYELAVNTKVDENLGAPVFDAAGHLVAIRTRADPLDPTLVFAIPIRYGIELMGT